jgi:hypothetical protein
MQWNGILVLWTGLLCAGEPAKPITAQPAVVGNEKKAVQYEVDVQVVKADPAGRDLGPYGRGRFLAEPRLITLDGHSVSFLAGGQAAATGRTDGSQSFILIGTILDINVISLSNDRVRLKMTLELAQKDETVEQGVVVVGTIIRAVKDLKLGELVKLTERATQGKDKVCVWVRVHVVEGAGNTMPKPVVRDEAARAKPVKVGEIKIVGNTTVDADIIRGQIPFYPGQTVTDADLRLAEKNLERTNLFRVEPGKGIRPTVEVLSSKSEYKDVLITVEENPAGPAALQKR